MDDIYDFTVKENKGLDKIQALFADMSERMTAWDELSRVDGLGAGGVSGIQY